ncbi:hypothetical protein SAMN04489724_2553 [Algoriphagus locisalis]|uniref:Uncharacterized protein n=1 Tax=Algoriphagus locisalis TaxID=305507 RepID=A0A1I7BMV8_9BACT|nr:hypothetical protein SAMN04489724_2553 [Algoriphagus locisalis]
METSDFQIHSGLKSINQKKTFENVGSEGLDIYF